MAGIREWIQRRCKGAPSQQDIDKIRQDLTEARVFVESLLGIAKKMQPGTETGKIIKNGNTAVDRIIKASDAIKRLGGR